MKRRNEETSKSSLLSKNGIDSGFKWNIGRKSSEEGQDRAKTTINKIDGAFFILAGVSFLFFTIRDVIGSRKKVWLPPPCMTDSIHATLF